MRECANSKTSLLCDWSEGSPHNSARIASVDITTNLFIPLVSFLI